MKNDFSKSIDLNLNSISEEVLSEKIEEFFEVVDRFTERTRLYEVQTTADDLALEKWNTMMKRFGTSIWSCWKRGDITVSEALETLQNRKKINQWKKQRWDYSQQETKNELDKFKGWADEDGHEFDERDIMVSKRPDPAEWRTLLYE